MHKLAFNVPEVVFLGTFPPTNEGIATFNEDLVNAFGKIVSDNVVCSVAAVNLTDTSPFYFDGRIKWEIDQETLDTYVNVAADINSNPRISTVVIQHEYGIYGGGWGAHIVEFLKVLTKPSITVMHTVTDSITYKREKFKEVTEQIVKLSTALVCLSKSSEKKLKSFYPESSAKIYFIPHGIHPVDFVNPKTAKKNLRLDKNTVLTTFGFLSRSKGIEYVIQALPEVIQKYPNVIYQILGQTHPVVRKREGEEYRIELVKLVKKLGIRKNVRFVDKYLDLDELLYYLKATDIYVATSLSYEQAVSGTFSYALGTGRAVVSTRFVQSEEMITPGTGRLVESKNPKAYTEAILDLLSEKNALLKYHRLAYRRTRSMLWSNVAHKYANIIEHVALRDKKKLVLPAIDLTHLIKMTDRNGMLQFAKYDIPAYDFGYTVDDNSRALIAATLLLDRGFPHFKLKLLFRRYFDFVASSLQPDGTFLNYFDENLKSTEQNAVESPLDHYGRVLTSLAYVLKSDKVQSKFKTRAKEIWKKAFNKVYVLNHTRPNALTLKSLCYLFDSKKPDEDVKNIIINLAEILSTFYKNNNSKDWHWFEDKISYNNAILPESLALAYKITKNKKYLKIAEKTFGFLIKHTFLGDVFAPVGQKSWFVKGKKRSFYDQQPEDVSSMVLGLVTMYEITNKEKYLTLAKKAFSWFLGNNLNGIPVYNYKTGGVYDGLTPYSINKNQGAEALLSYLIARLVIEKYY